MIPSKNPISPADLPKDKTPTITCSEPDSDRVDQMPELTVNNEPNIPVANDPVQEDTAILPVAEDVNTPADEMEPEIERTRTGRINH